MPRQGVAITEIGEAVTVSEKNQQEQQINDLKNQEEQPKDTSIFQETMDRRNKLLDKQAKDDLVNEFENQEEQFMDEREEQKTLPEESKDITIF